MVLELSDWLPQGLPDVGLLLRCVAKVAFSKWGAAVARMLQMPHPELTESETLGAGPRGPCFNKPLQ